MSLLHDLIPQAPDGGSRFGIHFLKDWWECPLRAAYRHLIPHPDQGGHGIVPTTTTIPLEVGSLFHTWAEEWYRSRCRDGEDTHEPDPSLAWQVVEEAMIQREGNLEHKPELIEKVRTQLQGLATRYHDYYGPGGTLDERGTLTVLFDAEGEPLLEREVTVPIAEGLEFTVRIDLIANWKGYPTVIEHKTTTAQGLWQRVSASDLDSQMAGELLGLRYTFYDSPDLAAINTCLVNIASKNPSRREGAVPAFYRHATSRSEMDLTRFQRDVEHSLNLIEDWLSGYQLRLGAGMGEMEAVQCTFPKVGMMCGTCNRYNRSCSYEALCLAPGRETQAIRGFRPRIREENPVA